MHRAVDRLRAEFLEMPGLRLTAEQAHRFCGVERAACASALDELVQEKFLSEKPDGTYARATDDDVSRRRAAKAAIPSRRQAS